MALGKQMASELQRRTRAIEDTRIKEYVDSLGRRVASAIPETKTPFTFTVIADDPCPTAHERGSLPGGYIFVPAALFLEAQSEAEFAGMLARPMAHPPMSLTGSRLNGAGCSSPLATASTRGIPLPAAYGETRSTSQAATAVSPATALAVSSTPEAQPCARMMNASRQ
jgi:hypothetical protein